ncbi:MAG: phosphoribosylglycinamide formyltransferase [Planctomycetaceae bacterium]|nr:phosphoribosylglycinamide formyltransferase [Planctomycetaceae bacterium]
MRFPSPLRVVALISGGGRTVLNLLDRIEAGQLPVQVELVVANKPCSGIERIQQRGIPVELMQRSSFAGAVEQNAAIFNRIRQTSAYGILLAGYLARIEIPDDFLHRVINIHPSLIPAFCGKGMFGEHVHAAAIQRGCKVSGCTVHFCDNEYDHGPIIMQQTVPVLDDDTAESLAARVFEAECEAFPGALLKLMQDDFEVDGSRVLFRS